MSGRGILVHYFNGRKLWCGVRFGFVTKAVTSPRIADVTCKKCLVVKAAVAIALLLISLPRGADAGWWSGFCERHLACEDPYQYEGLTVDQLVGTFWRHRNEKFPSKALTNELRSRLNDPYLGDDDREIIEKTLGN